MKLKVVVSEDRIDWWRLHLAASRRCFDISGAVCRSREPNNKLHHRHAWNVIDTCCPACLHQLDMQRDPYFDAGDLIRPFSHSSTSSSSSSSSSSCPPSFFHLLLHLLHLFHLLHLPQDLQCWIFYSVITMPFCFTALPAITRHELLIPSLLVYRMLSLNAFNSIWIWIIEGTCQNLYSAYGYFHLYSS